MPISPPKNLNSKYPYLGVSKGAGNLSKQFQIYGGNATTSNFHLGARNSATLLLPYESSRD